MENTIRIMNNTVKWIMDIFKCHCVIDQGTEFMGRMKNKPGNFFPARTFFNILSSRYFVQFSQNYNYSKPSNTQKSE